MGKSNTQKNIYLDEVKNAGIAIPNIKEQQTIANYLDNKTAQIDKKIELLTEKAALYGKLKQSIINETVTRGLDKTVAMKDSGVEWLGEIPAHWFKGRIKDFAEINPTTKIPSNINENDLVEFIPMTNIDEKLGKIKKFNYEALSEVSTGYTKFKNGDVIFAKITPCMENGNCAIVYNLSHGICFGSTEFIVFRPAKKITEKYLHYFLHNDIFRKNAEPFMMGTAGQKRISSHFMSTHFFMLPPHHEQQTISNYLDEKTATIDRIIETLNAKIEKLKELRKTLINDVVTGKICVNPINTNTDN
jgi:type I restriction enzyme S subunit